MMQRTVNQKVKDWSLTLLHGQTAVKLGSNAKEGEVIPYELVESKTNKAASQVSHNQPVEYGAIVERYARLLGIVLAGVTAVAVAIAAIVAVVKFAYQVFTNALARLWQVLLANDIPFYVGATIAFGLVVFALYSVTGWHKGKSPSYEYWREEKPKKQAQQGVTIIHNYNFKQDEK